MKPLRKSEHVRFETVCRVIREALHLEHWESRYTSETTQPLESPSLFATNRSYMEGRRLWIAVFPAFYDLSAEEQIRTLIHEHVHTIHNPHTQIICKIIDWSHEGDRRWAEAAETKASELVTDHLTCVLYDLIKDRFEKA